MRAVSGRVVMGTLLGLGLLSLKMLKSPSPHSAHITTPEFEHWD